MQFTSYRIGQMKGESTWCIWEETRDYENHMGWPKTTSIKVRENIGTEDYARILCRVMNGCANDVSKTIRALDGLGVYDAEGNLHPVAEVPAQCIVY